MAGAGGLGADDFLQFDESAAESVDERIALEAGIVKGLAADRGDADGISVAGDALDDPLCEREGFPGIGWPEEESVFTIRAPS